MKKGPVEKNHNMHLQIPIFKAIELANLACLKGPIGTLKIIMFL
jgi:hypothetical protein